MANERVSAREATLRLVLTALFMALNIVFSSSVMSIPVPGGHVYLNDAIVVIAGLLLSPYEAFAVGGIGAFLGDFFFYPAPMWVSLVTHGLQAVMISLISHKTLKKHKNAGAIVAIIVGIVINVAGYTIGRRFFYGNNPAAAMIKLPWQILQASVGSALGAVLVMSKGLPALIRKTMGLRLWDPEKRTAPEPETEPAAPEDDEPVCE